MSKAGYINFGGILSDSIVYCHIAQLPYLLGILSTIYYNFSWTIHLFYCCYFMKKIHSFQMQANLLKGASISIPECFVLICNIIIRGFILANYHFDLFISLFFFVSSVYFRQFRNKCFLHSTKCKRILYDGWPLKIA